MGSTIAPEAERVAINVSGREIRLTREDERIIESLVASGRFDAPFNVISTALHLLNERELDRQRKLDELRAKVAVGLAEADRGECEPLDLWEILAEVEQELAAGRGPTQP
jgi:antitoxin ParD1/3/4